MNRDWQTVLWKIIVATYFYMKRKNKISVEYRLCQRQVVICICVSISSNPLYRELHGLFDLLNSGCKWKNQKFEFFYCWIVFLTEYISKKMLIATISVETSILLQFNVNHFHQTTVFVSVFCLPQFLTSWLHFFQNIDRIVIDIYWQFLEESNWRESQPDVDADY